MINIAHRGASRLAPEHTFAAYDLALSQRADYLELDVQMTLDGAVVVLHDPTLGRTARGPAGVRTRAVAQTSLAEIKKCDVGAWFNNARPGRAKEDYLELEIPTLDEVFSRYGTSANYLVEIKHPCLAPGIEQTVLELIEHHALLEGSRDGRHPIFLQSFDPSSLRKIHLIDDRIPLVQLYRRDSEGLTVALLEEAAGYAAGIGPSFGNASTALVSVAHDLGLNVYPYTVNSAETMKHLMGRGVDGIITDRPERLDHVLGRSAARAPVCRQEERAS